LKGKGDGTVGFLVFCFCTKVCILPALEKAMIRVPMAYRDLEGGRKVYNVFIPIEAHLILFDRIIITRSQTLSIH
jgi:hypothetical protein